MITGLQKDQSKYRPRLARDGLLRIVGREKWVGLVGRVKANKIRRLELFHCHQSLNWPVEEGSDGGQTGSRRLECHFAGMRSNADTVKVCFFAL